MSLANDLRQQAPDVFGGLSDTEVLEKFRSRYGIRDSVRQIQMNVGERAEPSAGENFAKTLTAIGQGATFGFGDELAGVVGGTADTLGGVASTVGNLVTLDFSQAYAEARDTVTGKKFGEGYDAVAGQARRMLRELREDRPARALAAEVLGGIATGGGMRGMAKGAQATAAAGAPTATSGLSNAAQRAMLATTQRAPATGARMQQAARMLAPAEGGRNAARMAAGGGLYGVGTGEGASDRAVRGLVGTGLGAAAPVAGKVVKRAADLSPTTNAGRALLRLAGNAIAPRVGGLGSGIREAVRTMTPTIRPSGAASLDRVAKFVEGRGTVSIGQVASSLGISKTTAKRHLTTLRNNGVVHMTKKDGKWVITVKGQK